jgi:hypothetical protein
MNLHLGGSTTFWKADKRKLNLYVSPKVYNNYNKLVIFIVD